jgi:hypothetical protein
VYAQAPAERSALTLRIGIVTFPGSLDDTDVHAGRSRARWRHACSALASVTARCSASTL